jgi:hypothetical protein
VDLLIDGPYIASLNNGNGLRGSSNQRFIHLTDRLAGHDFSKNNRKLEIHINGDSAMFVGIPPRSAGTGLPGITPSSQPIWVSGGERRGRGDAGHEWI